MYSSSIKNARNSLITPRVHNSRDLYACDHFSKTSRYICISYVTSVRYVSGINHEARGHTAPEGRVIYSGNVLNHGRDISNLFRREPAAMVNGTKFLVLSPKNRFKLVSDITLIGS